MGVTIDNVLRKNKEGMPSFSPEKYNGIDVKMVDKISQIVKYVTKYVTKMKELNFNKSWAAPMGKMFTLLATPVIVDITVFSGFLIVTVAAPYIQPINTCYIVH